MLPFDQQIQKANSADHTNQTPYNMPTPYAFPNPSFPWNMDYPHIQSLSYYPSSNYFFMPSHEFQGLDEIKEANQPTRANQVVENLQNPLKEDRVQQPIPAAIEKPAESKLRQKYGRNILSNIFHMTIKKILSPEFNKIIDSVIQSNKMMTTVTDFKTRLQQKSKEIKGYINMKAIRLLLVGRPIGATKSDIEFRRLLRILCRVYNYNYHLPHIYHTGKIKKESRELHLKCLRKLTMKSRK